MLCNLGCSEVSLQLVTPNFASWTGVLDQSFQFEDVRSSPRNACFDRNGSFGPPKHKNGVHHNRKGL